jgi:hypothetical protein
VPEKFLSTGLTAKQSDQTSLLKKPKMLPLFVKINAVTLTMEKEVFGQ